MELSMGERYQYVLRKLNEQGFVKVYNLSKELQVSSVTIRKDLKALEDRELLFRTHGGATSLNQYTNIPYPRPLIDKEKSNREAKQNIAKAAALLIEENDSIIIASGTTVIEFARNIGQQRNITVLSSTLNVSEILSKHPKVEVIQLGGIIRKSSNSVIGSFAEKMLADLMCNKLFVGVDGIDLTYGLTTTSSMEASLNKVMIDSAQKVIVLSDSSKFGKRSFGRICGLDKVDILITDKFIKDSFKKSLETSGVKVIVA
ncbi:MAG TPA: DeoR/GlpR transcriptional regulator [Ignavibacteria bacterium]|nr:DeoR/GlpR transcriptional regulator [Ignavibacteria bacterium]